MTVALTQAQASIDRQRLKGHFDQSYLDGLSDEDVVKLGMIFGIFESVDAAKGEDDEQAPLDT